MANETVVDSLVVKLSLEAEQYAKAEKEVNKNADRTERKAKERDRTGTRRDKDQQKRLKDVAAGVKSFAVQVMAAAGVVSGLGIAIGASLTGLVNFETGLRRQAVGTGLSNKQMQAWGATARRLGADAGAGAQAIADLAREQKGVSQGLPAPTLAALSKFGVRFGPDTPIEDVIGQAQQVYHNAAPAQQQAIETGLGAQGVSSDLILMIKSDIDARATYDRSYAQAIEENKKGLSEFTDVLETVKAVGINFANSMLTLLQPSVEIGAQKIAELATKVIDFTQDIVDAGGGLDGFRIALEKNVPGMGRLFEGFQMEADILKGVVDIIVGSLSKFGETADKAFSWLGRMIGIDEPTHGGKGQTMRQMFNNLTGGQTAGQVAQRVVLAADDTVRAAVGNARGYNDNKSNAPWPKNIEEGAPGANPNNLPKNIEEGAPSGSGASGAQGLMQQLVTKYGLSPAQAAGVTANLQAESGLDPAAFNGKGGGQGAQGIAQWRGPRIDAFRKRYGVDPRNATLDQQIEFMMTDPSERAQLNRALKSDDAGQTGVAVSREYERHGNVREDARRGQLAQQLAAQYAPGAAGASGGTQISIQHMEVKANDPREMVGGLQRVAGANNYATVLR